MPDKNPPPPFLLIALAALAGVIGQLGASLAFDMARDTRKLAGFLLLSLIFSSTSTVLFSYFTEWPDHVCAALGSILGTLPALWTLRLGFQKIGQRFGVDTTEIMNAPKPPTNEGGKPHDQ